MNFETNLNEEIEEEYIFSSDDDSDEEDYSDEDEDVEAVSIQISSTEERKLKNSYVEWWKDERNNPFYPQFVAEEGPSVLMDPGRNSVMKID